MTEKCEIADEHHHVEDSENQGRGIQQKSVSFQGEASVHFSKWEASGKGWALIHTVLEGRSAVERHQCLGPHEVD